MKGVQCYELFGGIALKIHTFSFFFSFLRETQCIKSILENVSFVKKEDVILLGSPITSTAIRPQFQHKLSIFKAMTEKISLLDRHPAYFLLKTAFQCQS